MRAPVIHRRDCRQTFRAREALFLLISARQTRVAAVMSMIDVTADAVPHRAANQHVGKIVMKSGKARDANGAGNSISCYLDRRMIVIPVGNDGGHGPCIDAVARWE